MAACCPRDIEILELGCCAQQLPSTQRPQALSISAAAGAPNITTAGDLKASKNRPDTSPPDILDTLIALAEYACSFSGSQNIDLRLNHASLYLSEKRFPFFQAEANLFRRKRILCALHCRDIVSLQDAAGLSRFHPNAELHRRILLCPIAASASD
jgi:hypothetical protein